MYGAGTAFAVPAPQTVEKDMSFHIQMQEKMNLYAP